MDTVSKILRGSKHLWLLFICLCLFLIGVLGSVLSKHLLEVQIDERLMKAAKEHETLVFTFEASKEEKKFSLLDKEEYHYYLYGIDEAFISYGSTTTTFKDALLKNYIDIETMLDGCVKKESKENTNYYIHTSMKENENYKIAIETKRDEEGNALGYYITLYPANVDLDISLKSDSLDTPQRGC